jgi:catechol 2,3-dioxygenase-like lactoylglutathione lyase family enzyme
VIHHIDLAVADLEKSCEFYSRALAPLNLGLVERHKHPDGHEVVGFGVLPDPVFWIRNGRRPITQLHVAFLATSRASVDCFYQAALESGGVGNGEPGLRPRYTENYYAAFVLDPDGNNIEAVCRQPEGVHEMKLLDRGV